VLAQANSLHIPLADGSVHMCVTSPPYWGLRDYGVSDQLGLEPTPEAYVADIVAVMREVWRVMRDDGTCWLNLGDSYAGSWGNYGAREGNQRSRIAERWHRPGYEDPRQGWDGLPPTAVVPGLKPKDLVGIPWRVAFALQADGWYLRSDIIWAKPNPMPESVTDRCTKSHEYIFLLSKSAAYRCDMDAIAEKSAYPGDNRAERSDTRKSVDPMCMDGGSRARTGNPTGETRNKRSVWTVSTKPYAGAHFATFPPDLIEPCILAGAPAGGVVLDPFFGSGTTGQVAQALGRRYIGIELNEAYKPLQDERLCQPSLDLEAA